MEETPIKRVLSLVAKCKGQNQQKLYEILFEDTVHYPQPEKRINEIWELVLEESFLQPNLVFGAWAFEALFTLHQEQIKSYIDWSQNLLVPEPSEKSGVRGYSYFFPAFITGLAATSAWCVGGRSINGPLHVHEPLGVWLLSYAKQTSLIASGKVEYDRKVFYLQPLPSELSGYLSNALADFLGAHKWPVKDNREGESYRRCALLLNILSQGVPTDLPECPSRTILELVTHKTLSTRPVHERVNLLKEHFMTGL